MKNATAASREASHQTVPLQVETAHGLQSIQLGFSEQRLSAHGGLVLMSSFLQKLGWRRELAAALPHQPTSPNAYAPVDIALGFIGGVLAGADKFSRVGQLCGDEALPHILGIEAVPSQPTLTRFFAQFSQRANAAFAGLHRFLARKLPSHKGGYTLDLDSTAILHEEGHQEGVRPGYTPRGLKPGHHPLLAALAEPKLVSNFWLRSGDTVSASNVVNFLKDTLAHLPAQVRVGLLRADSGFYCLELLRELEQRRIDYIVVAKLRQNLQNVCRHADEAWSQTEVPGLEVQEVEAAKVHGLGQRRLIVIRHRVAARPQAGGKTLLEVEGYRFQALCTSLPRSWSPLALWRRYHGRADVENRIKELGGQFGLRRFCCRSFWGTEAACHLAILAYNLCVLFQRELGLLQKVELSTLRFRLFARAAVFSEKAGRPTLKFAIPKPQRDWWSEVLEKLRCELPPFNCNSVGAMAA
jgi:DNA-directed RNA polymerase subunit N (RpoN/RPB10)